MPNLFAANLMRRATLNSANAIIASLTLLTGCAQTAPQSPKIGLLQASNIVIPEGNSSFIYRDAKGRDIKVFSYKSASFTPTSTIWFTMHGLGREAEKTRDEWLVAADQNSLLILAPEFSEANFPKGADYTVGEITGADFSKSNYVTIERIFDAATAATGSTQKVYGMYGHSAGGQFIQKMMLLTPETRADFSIAANAGWYLLPSCTEIAGAAANFPYSFANGPYSAADCPAALARGLSRNVLVLLGAEDRDADHPQLSKTKGAMLQGSNRFDRGSFFIEQMRIAAEAQKQGHKWKAQVVPGIGHEASQMAQSALFLTYRPGRSRR